MRTKARLVGLAALSVPVLGLGADPAGAAQATGTGTITFHSQGQEVTCTFQGISSVSYASVDDMSWMTLRTELVNPSAACQRNLVVLRAEGIYRLAGETDTTYFEGRAGLSGVFARARASGVATSLDGFHSAQFLCDEEPENCLAGFATSAK